MKGASPKKEEKKGKEKPTEKKAASPASKKEEEKLAAKGGSVVVSRNAHPCKRPHPFQDERYGGGRVANIAKKGTARRCTVCGEVV